MLLRPAIQRHPRNLEKPILPKHGVVSHILAGMDQSPLHGLCTILNTITLDKRLGIKKNSEYPNQKLKLP